MPIKKLKSVNQQLNCFKNHITIKQSDVNPTQISYQNIFSDIRHTLFFNNKTELLDKLKNIIRLKVTNALHIDEQILFHFENDIMYTTTVSIVLARKTVDDTTEIEQ